jgi:predicted nucleotidyltransferase component of viral defense system
MKGSATNTAASVLARLKNIADKERLDFNVLLLRYIQERFLGRLAVSGFVNRFVLKGGLLLVAYNVERARPTRDIDFLGVGLPDDYKDVESVMRQIASVDIDDGVRFLADSIRSEMIKEDANYEGVRIKLTAKIGSARTSIQLDLAFGDVVSPQPIHMDYPTLLDKTSFKVLAYSRESIVAEKLEAIVRLSTFNSRMKDFYDLLFLSSEFEFEGGLLQEAIMKTFTRRQTSIASAKELFDSDLADQVGFQRLWEAFKRRTNLTTNIDFKGIFEEIRAFLGPVVDAGLEEKAMSNYWDRKAGKWR